MALAHGAHRSFRVGRTRPSLRLPLVMSLALALLAVGYVALRAVIDYARGVNMTGRGTRVRGSVGGIMQNPNDLALNMVVFLPPAVYFALGARTRLRQLIAAGCALVMTAPVLGSRVRSFSGQDQRVRRRGVGRGPVRRPFRVHCARKLARSAGYFRLMLSRWRPSGGAQTGVTCS